MTDTPPAFRYRFRIYYDDTDASGVVYHAAYLRYFERARTELLRALGFGQERLRVELDRAFTIARIEVHYRVPARLDDEIEVSVVTTRARRASVEFAQQMSRLEDGVLLASAAVRAGCVQFSDFRPAPMPDAIRNALLGVVE